MVDSHLDLYTALGFEKNPIEIPADIAFVGSGGKTTAMFQLARQLLDRQFDCVFITTTTHIAESEKFLADRIVVVSSSEELNLAELGNLHGLILITGPVTSSHRFSSLGRNQLNKLWKTAQKEKIPLLIEADGSRRRPLKAPADFEPVIPDFVSMVIVVAGLSGLGQIIHSDIIHRPDIFAELCGQTLGDRVIPNHILRVLTHPMGGLKGIPEKAKRILIMNQIDKLAVLDQACFIAHGAIHFYDKVILAQLGIDPEGIWADYEPTAGIILAAGSASRYGKTKQLEVWRGRSALEHIIQTALAGGLAPVRIILGYDHEVIRNRIEIMAEFPHKTLEIIENLSWSLGQSTSVRAGVSKLPMNVGGAVFLLADQPMIPVEIIKVLQDVRAHNRSWVTAPKYQGQRVNPALFGRELFSALMNLTGDIGGRSLLKEPIHFPVSWVPWDDPWLKLDFDTYDDYIKMIEMDSL